MSSFDETLSQNEIYLMVKILREKFKTESKETEYIPKKCGTSVDSGTTGPATAKRNTNQNHSSYPDAKRPKSENKTVFSAFHLDSSYKYAEPKQDLHCMIVEENFYSLVKIDEFKKMMGGSMGIHKVTFCKDQEPLLVGIYFQTHSIKHENKNKNESICIVKIGEEGNIKVFNLINKKSNESIIVVICDRIHLQKENQSRVQADKENQCIEQKQPKTILTSLEKKTVLEAEKFKLMEDQVQSFRQKLKETQEIVKNKNYFIATLKSEINVLNKQIEKYKQTFTSNDIDKLLKMSHLFLEIFGDESNKAKTKEKQTRVVLSEAYPTVRIDSALKNELLRMFQSNPDSKIFRKYICSVIGEEKIAETTGAILYTKHKIFFDSFIEFMHQNGRKNFGKREAVIVINNKKQELNSQKRAFKNSNSDNLRRNTSSFTGMPTSDLNGRTSTASHLTACSTPNKSRIPDLSF